MLRNYLKIALRTLWKERLYSFINIGGLSIGLASALLIYVFINQELSYDQFHKDSDRIYRVGFEVSLGTGTKVIASSPHKLATYLKNEFPQLEESIHFSRIYEGEVTYGDKKMLEERMAFVDSSFFDVFNFNLVTGSKKALVGPNTVILTSSMAKKYFGEADPLGKRIKIQEPYGDGDMDLEIVGVLEDMPINSHFHMDFLISMATGKEFYPDGLYESWGWDSQYTYVKLSDDYSIDKFQAELKDFGRRHIEGKWFIEFFAQPINEIHLTSNLNSEIEANSDYVYVYIFGIVAVIILLLACVNYMNLATAKAINRSKEVCIRKSIGAGKKQIVGQFLGESIAYSTIALVIGGFLAELMAQPVSAIINTQLTINIIQNLPLLLSFIMLGLCIGIVSGSYPAFYISRFNPVQILRTTANHGIGSVWLRKLLVLIQFALSIALLIGSSIIYNQVHFLRNKKVGASVEHNIVIPSSVAVSEKIDLFKNELLKHEEIISVTTAGRRIGRDINSGTFYSVENNGQLSEARLSNIFVDYNYLEHYHVELVAGRYFDKEIASDEHAVILNESALKALDILNPEDALNKEIKAWFTASIIGVVKDFHFETIHNKIKPMIFVVDPSSSSWITIKLKGNDTQETIAYIQNQWRQIESNRTFRYSFLDEDLYNLYIAEERFLKIFTLSVGLALFIACLGLLGLVTFTVSLRIKEIGIRKVLGANAGDITLLLSSDFIKLIIWANIIAYPVAYFAAKNWLNNFEYRTSIPWWGFLAASFVALFIAQITILIKSQQAARLNPVETIKEN